MRLSEPEILAGITHPSGYVREVALRYFEDSFRRQPDVTRQLIAAVEQFGWEDVFEYPHRVAYFELDADTLPWAFGEIERTGTGAPSANMRWHLAQMIANAPIDVVRPHLERLQDIDVFRERRATFSERRRTEMDNLQLRNELFEKSPEGCWALLERHCRDIGDVETFADADIPYAEALVERIAAGGQAFADRVHEILERPNVTDGYNEWIQGLALTLAGRLRLESAAELIYGKFHIEWDWYNEVAAEALKRIGTPAVTHLLCQRYEARPWHIRLYSLGILEAVHHDAAVEEVLRLDPQEQDDDLRSQLGVALASHFDERGIEPALAIYHEDPEDVERSAIVEHLFAHTTLANIDRPEKSHWEEVYRLMWSRSKASRNELLPKAHWSHDDRDWDDEDDDWDEDTWDTGSFNDSREAANSGHKLQPIVHTEPRVGRNEQCPCGSGKKYKNCCLRNTPK
jgi:hypothetical protein